jgi:predicted metal-binding membrane protein
MTSAALAALLRHDRAVVLGGLGAVTAAAWVYLFFGAGVPMAMMDMGGGQMMAMPAEWTPAYALLIVTMWVVMMVAMMLPAALPVVLLAATIDRRRGASGMPGRSALFTSGYLLAWTGFSIAATALQWALDTVGLLSESMAMANRLLAGAILLAAGIYQWTSLKEACLAHCRSPMGFLMQHWRASRLGAVAIGLRHGLFCIGCCWVLMALLFVGGLMNLLWVGAITLLVLVEKTTPWGGRMARIGGAVLAVWGAATLATAI